MCLIGSIIRSVQTFTVHTFMHILYPQKSNVICVDTERTILSTVYMYSIEIDILYVDV